METLWSPRGWRPSRAWPSPEVMAQAVKAAIMFGQPRTHDHDGWVRAARTAVRACTAAEAG